MRNRSQQRQVVTRTLRMVEKGDSKITYMYLAQRVINPDWSRPAGFGGHFCKTMELTEPDAAKQYEEQLRYWRVWTSIKDNMWKAKQTKE